eukprot:scaffold158467_cov28-Tisochrysis_lutea.AAC.2
MVRLPVEARGHPGARTAGLSHTIVKDPPDFSFTVVCAGELLGPTWTLMVPSGGRLDRMGVK